MRSLEELVRDDSIHYFNKRGSRENIEEYSNSLNYFIRPFEKLENKIKEPDSIFEISNKNFLKEDYGSNELYSRLIDPHIKYEKSIIYKINSYNNNKKSLESLIDSYLDLGYSIKNREHISDREYIPAQKKKPEIRIEVPKRFLGVFIRLAQEHPGLRYMGTVTLQHPSRHTVEVVTFTYVEKGQMRELPVVAKQFSAEEMNFYNSQRQIPEWLKNDCGFIVHDMIKDGFGFNPNGVFMEYVGDVDYKGKEVDLGKVVKRGNEIAIRLAELHTKATPKIDALKEKYGVELGTRAYDSDLDSKVFGIFTKSSDVEDVDYQIAVNNLIEAAKPLIAKLGKQEYFIHGDLRIENIRFGNKADIIDWESARKGNIFWDIARCVLSIQTHSDYKSGFSEEEFKANYKHEFMKNCNDPDVSHNFEEMYQTSKVFEAMVRIGAHLRIGKTKQAANYLEQFLSLSEANGMYELRNAFIDYMLKTKELSSSLGYKPEQLYAYAKEAA